MDIKHSRRILSVGAPGSRVLDVVKDLTGNAPALNEMGTTAGLTHEWDAETAYYKAKVPIWIDEIADTEAWKEEFLKPEAQEVVQVVGAWIYCFEATEDGRKNEEIEGTMRAIADIVERHTELGSEATMLAVHLPSAGHNRLDDEARKAEWEDICLVHGFEFISYGAQGTNEFGEKVGFERLKEALEANEWAAATDDDELEIDDIDFDLDDDLGASGREEAEWTTEFFGVKAALAGDQESQQEPEDTASADDQAAQVEDLDMMMSKLLAVKEQSANLPEAQRKKMAAQAVRDIMKAESSK